MAKDIGIGVPHEQGQLEPLCRSVSRLAPEEGNDMPAYGRKVRIAALPEFVDIRSHEEIKGVGLFRMPRSSSSWAKSILSSMAEKFPSTSSAISGREP